MKKILPILLKVILVICGLLLLIYLLLWLPPVQQKIKDFALQEVMKKTKNQMHVGNLRFSPFNHILLEDVYVSGLQGDTLLYAENIDAGFNLFKLLNKKLLIYSAEVDNFNIQIFKDSTFNFRFLIDAFVSDAPADSSAMQIEIDKIILKNGNLSYNVLAEPCLADSLFDVNHISIQNLQAEIHLQSIDMENLNADIANLSFTEKCGFKLDDLHFNLKSKQKVISLNDFAVSLPHSELKIKEAKLDYTNMDINDIFTKAAYSFPAFSGKVSRADLAYFYPPLNEFPDILSFSGKLEGQFPELNILALDLNYGEKYALTANARMFDLYNWEKSAFVVQIDNCLIDKIETPVVLNKIGLTGKISGSLPDIDFHLQGKNEQININLQGKITGKEKIDANLNADIKQFNYQGYSYKNIYVKASYVEKNIRFDIKSEDENLPLALQGSINPSKENQEATLHANLHGIRLDALKWLPEYPGAKLSGLVDAHVKGFDPEAMTASVTIDSLRFSTSNGVFSDSPININYNAASNKQKQLHIRSRILNLAGKGEITYAGVDYSLRQAFPVLFSEKTPKKRKIQLPEENFNVLIAIRQANTISHLLGMESEIPDSALFIGEYSSGDSLVNFDATAFCLFSATDTSKLHLNLSNSRDKLTAQFDVDNHSMKYALTGDISAEIEFIRNAKNKFPDMHIELNPGSVSLNETAFQIYPAQIDIRDKRYEINNFALRHSSSEYLKIDGIVSGNPGDSLWVDINRFEIGTILSALKYNIPLSGSASGEIWLSQLTTEPRIVTRSLSVNDILFQENSIGNLQLTSVWNSALQGLWVGAMLKNPQEQESIVSGIFSPKEKEFALNADIQGIQLKWFDSYVAGSVNGLDGELGAKIQIEGKISDPVLIGRAYLKNAKAGVTQLNTMYQISDSIELRTDKIIFNEFTIYDDEQNTGKINGTIGYKWFSDLNPKLTLDFNNFLVLNNPEQTDSLFFGRLQVNGRLNVSMQNKNWLVQGNLTHGSSYNMVLANIPETAEAHRYGWITFVGDEKETSGGGKQNPKPKETSDVSLPVKLNITFSVNPDLTAGVLLNPVTWDIAEVQGNGNIGLSYDLNTMKMSLQGVYSVEDGGCSISLKNITRKNFHIQSGGKLVFNGDPLNTSFDLTAVYKLKASLTSLDPSFAEITSASKIPVNCLLTTSGSMNKMQLNYRVVLPNEADEVQRKLDGLLYTEDLKIKEIAYLLALGSFMPVNSGTQTPNSSDIWTSIASSSITSQLNNLLSGVLSDNWTIGTDLHSRDGSMSRMDMDVNISTKLFNERLVVNGTLGYHNNMDPDDETNNFTGDFDLEYKLSPGGNVLLRFFNVTNNQYYERARTTQGVGIVYKRQGKTFKQLFRSFRTKKKQESK